MPYNCYFFSSVSRFGMRTARSAILVASGLALAPAVSAQAFRTELLGQPTLVRVQAQAANPETVRLLSGLAKIESDLQLGMLFLMDGLTNPEGSHFTHPRAETWPEIKDALLAAGVADFEALLQKLEAGGEQEAVVDAYTEVIAALMHARTTLNPSDKDAILSIVEQARAVVGEINAEGPTEVNNYQDAWAMLMVARSQVDLLMKNKDPAIAKAAGDMAMAFDDVILSMPDPSVKAPVDFDPSPIISAVGMLEALAGSV